MDKLTIVMSNYMDVECDANTTPRQAYERGFRRATKKCETVMHSRKIEKEKALIENDQLMAENAKLRELVRDVYMLNWNGFDCTECPWFDECRTEGGCPWLGILHDRMRELGIEVFHE